VRGAGELVPEVQDPHAAPPVLSLADKGFRQAVPDDRAPVHGPRHGSLADL
jgi:hypothetical protein